MDTISSGEFRKAYSRLQKQTKVTANGHVIGIWTPGPVLSLNDVQRQFEPGMTATPRQPRRHMTQAERDAILRRVNKGD